MLKVKKSIMGAIGEENFRGLLISVRGATGTKRTSWVVQVKIVTVRLLACHAER